MASWAKPLMDRKQIVLFSTTLDEKISLDHPVRLFDEILAQVGWQEWELQYVLAVGQPPIHPRVMASAILYGLTQGIRSSRQLERACANSVDFIWLVEGRGIDHSTFCGFRTRFAAELKSLFRQIAKIGMAMGLIQLNQVALDGTRVKANSSRHAMASAQSLEGRLAEVGQKLDALVEQMGQQDRHETDLYGQDVSPTHLPRPLADLKRRQELLQKALEKVRAKENAAQKPQGAERRTPDSSADWAEGATEESPAQAAGQEKDKARTPRVPLADPDSTLQPNKEGGFAPNYTPMAATDGAIGMIVDSDVLAHSDESGQALVVVDRIAAELGTAPQALLADGMYGTGATLEGLPQRGVTGFIPLSHREDPADNPARRSDPSQSVAPADWSKLPRGGAKKKLTRAAFVYDAQRDGYFCPMGHWMSFIGWQDKQRASGRGRYRKYRCSACQSCPMAATCVDSRRGFRILYREDCEPLREEMDARMKTEAGRTTYARRAWIGETPFAFLKQAMGLRQFLLRGLEKVTTEWRWSCIGYNLRKLMRVLGACRARWMIAMG